MTATLHLRNLTFLFRTPSYNYEGGNITPAPSPSPNNGEDAAPNSSVKKADIVFFIDSSVLMSEEINGVKTNLASFANSMAASGIDVRFAIIEYRKDKGVVTHKPDGVNTWTSDVPLVEAVLSTIYADDYDSDTLEAINEILSWGDFSNDASRFGFVLSDAILINDVHGESSFYDTYSKTDISETQAMQKLSTYMAGTIQSLNAMNMHLSVISRLNLQSAYNNLYSNTGGQFMDITGDYASIMLNIANYVEDVVVNDDPTNNQPATLPYMPLEAIPDDELAQTLTSGDITETILERIARQAGITSREINVITESNKHLYGLAAAPEPSDEAKKAAGDDQFIAKLNSLTLYSDFQQPGETGYFLAKIHVPDAVLSLGLTTDQMKLLSVTPDDSAQASSLLFRTAGTDPLSYWLFKKGSALRQQLFRTQGTCCSWGLSPTKLYSTC